jgi:phenylacetate-CoA ligase
MEKLIRNSAGRLQTVYDHAPYPVQNMMVSMRGWFLARIRYSKETAALLRELRTHEAWTAEQMLQYQLDAVQRTLDNARRWTPYYRGYPDVKIRDLEDLGKLPVLKRDMVREQNNELLSKAVPWRKRVRVTTTGTTGTSLSVYYSPEVSGKVWTYRMRQRAWLGLKPRTPRITLFGSRVIPPERKLPPFWVHNRPECQTLMSIFHLSAETVGDYVKYLQQHEGAVLEGFASVLGILAGFMLERGESVQMRAVFSDAEPLHPFLRTKIEAAFQTHVYDTYTMTEFCGLIQECEHYAMHLIPDYGFLEILDAEDNPVPPGKEGYFVWTGFVNDTMPLIRYRIGDRGCWLEENGQLCKCGRVFPRVIPTITRTSDMLYCRDGRIYSPRALNQVLKLAPSFRFCQFVQVAPDQLVVRAVSGMENRPDQLESLRRELEKIVGKSMQVSAQTCDAPIMRAGGKIPLIVQQVTP